MKFRQSLLELGQYTPPLEGRDPFQQILLDFNESPFPTPDHVINALSDFFQQRTLNRYPSYGHFLSELAQEVGIPEDHLILTNGSDQAIEIALRSMLDPGQEMVMALPGFSFFLQVAGTLDVVVRTPLYKNVTEFPLEEMQAAVNPRTRLIALVSPNNPTGTLLSLEQVEVFLRSFPEVMVLVDEAYFEFTQATALPLLKKYSNLVILRTFSKAFAIPALRLGYAIAHPSVIQQFYKIRGPYDVNMAAVVAAQAQLRHRDHWQAQVREVMMESKPMIEAFLQERGVPFYPSAANFMLVAPKTISHSLNFLAQNGILVRPMKAPIEHTFRLSVGSLEQTHRLLEVFAQLYC